MSERTCAYDESVPAGALLSPRAAAHPLTSSASVRQRGSTCHTRKV